jgi:hypothetical protein
VLLGALVYRLLLWCGAIGYVSGLRDAAASRKRPISFAIKNHLLHLVGLFISTYLTIMFGT